MAKVTGTIEQIMTLDANTDKCHQITIKAAAGENRTVGVQLLPTTAIGDTDDDYEEPEENYSIDVSDGKGHTVNPSVPTFIGKIKFTPSGVFEFTAKHFSTP